MNDAERRDGIMLPNIATKKFWVVFVSAIIAVLAIFEVLPTGFPRAILIERVGEIAGAVIAILASLGYLKKKRTKTERSK